MPKELERSSWSSCRSASCWRRYFQFMSQVPRIQLGGTGMGAPRGTHVLPCMLYFVGLEPSPQVFYPGGACLCAGAILACFPSFRPLKTSQRKHDPTAQLVLQWRLQKSNVPITGVQVFRYDESRTVVEFVLTKESVVISEHLAYGQASSTWNA